MAQYPVSDSQGILDGLNYALSGPSGTGQNFAGFSSSQNADLTGNFRPPFTEYNAGTLPNIGIYVAPITLSTSEMLDDRTLKFTYAVALTQPIFVLGQGFGLEVNGVSVSDYDTYVYDYGYQIGVIESTTTYVVVRLNSAQPILANGTGGTISLNSMNLSQSTDCNAKVTVTGAQDRVVLAAQLNNTIYIDPTYAPGSFYYTVELNRYKATPSNDPVTPDFRFEGDGNVATKTTLLSTPVVGSALDNIETLFINIIDEPDPGYYWYILEVLFEDNSGGQIVTNCVLGLRSFSAQVLKP